MPHRVRDTSLFLNRWLEKRNLSARDRGAVERVGAIGMALYNHSSGQHHRKRHGCEDKAHEFQPAAVSHRHSLVFTTLASNLSSIRFTMRYRKIRSVDANHIHRRHPEVLAASCGEPRRMGQERLWPS